MLIPKFSIRSLMLLMAVVGVVCLVASMATQGQAWAIAICVALASLIFIFSLYASVFLLAAPMAYVVNSMQRRPTPTNPFATQQPPPQILPPPEPE